MITFFTGVLGLLLSPPAQQVHADKILETSLDRLKCLHGNLQILGKPGVPILRKLDWSREIVYQKDSLHFEILTVIGITASLEKLPNKQQVR